MIKFIRTVAVTAMALTFAGAASAASIVGLQVEGGGFPNVYHLENGNWLGLWGFDNRDRSGFNAVDVTINSASDLVGGFTSGGGNIVNFFNGTNPINGGASEFDELTFGFDVAEGKRLFDSLWIEWTGGTLVYENPWGGTNTMGSKATLEGDPFADTAPVPLPAAAWMLMAAVGGLGIASRRCKA